MRNISADTQKNAPITHRIAVHNKRIRSNYFIIIPNCQFSICTYLPRRRIWAFFDRILYPVVSFPFPNAFPGFVVQVGYN